VSSSLLVKMASASRRRVAGIRSDGRVLQIFQVVHHATKVTLNGRRCCVAEVPEDAGAQTMSGVLEDRPRHPELVLARSFAGSLRDDDALMQLRVQYLRLCRYAGDLGGSLVPVDIYSTPMRAVTLRHHETAACIIMRGSAAAIELKFERARGFLENLKMGRRKAVALARPKR
jgi:hypothetical protein